jgi:hypothetical protein
MVLSNLLVLKHKKRKNQTVSESTSLSKAGERRLEAWSENFSAEKYL